MRPRPTEELTDQQPADASAADRRVDSHALRSGQERQAERGGDFNDAPPF